MGERTVRILHVTGGLNYGGVETWLMNVLRHIDRDRFQMDFVSHLDRECPYDAEARSLGSSVIPCLNPERPWVYARNFRRVLREHGPYHIVHSHVHHYNGLVMRLARQEGVPVRMVHSHNAPSDSGEKVSIARRTYIALMRQQMWSHSTLGLAVSETAADDLFGRNWTSDSRWRVMLLGIDLAPFRQSIDGSAVRRELGLPQDALVIGHAGRFAEQKNHRFLVEVILEAVRREPRVYALLVGTGELRPEIEQQVSAAGLERRVIFAGTRPDLPRLMMGAMDVFIMPSLHEAFGLVLAEAQAAGLPCIFSDRIAGEVTLVKSLVHRLPLTEPASVWAATALKTISSGPALGQPEACDIVERTPINIKECVAELERIYCENRYIRSLDGRQ